MIKTIEQIREDLTKMSDYETFIYVEECRKTYPKKMLDKVIDIANELNTRTITKVKIDEMVKLLEMSGENTKTKVLEMLKKIREENNGN